MTSEIRLGDDCSVSLMRTLRVPDDGGDYPLPPGLGVMESYRAADGVHVVPLHRGEALWLSFSAPRWRPHVLKVGAGRIDAVSGERFDATALTAEPQDYVVIPDQPWLDGINSGHGEVRQFVAVPLSEGLTVESQLDDGSEDGGIEFVLFAPKPGRFPDSPPPVDDRFDGVVMSSMACDEMGIGAGGRIRQEIYADEHGTDTWQPKPAARARIELVDALAFEALTGIRSTHPPVDAETYTRYGLPWFDLLSQTRVDIAASERLKGIRSLADLEGLRDAPLPIPGHQIRRLLELRSAPPSM